MNKSLFSCAKSIAISGILAATSNITLADEPFLLTQSDLKYVGAFLVTSTNNTEGKTGFSPGRFALSPETNSFFMNGLDTANGNTKITIAEFAIPEISNSLDSNDLQYTGAPLQEYSSFINRIPYKTDGPIVRDVAGMQLIDDRLFVTVFDPYVTISVPDNVFVVESPFDLANSEVTGYFGIEGETRSAGWLAPIPVNLQNDLGGDYLIGMARQASVNRRWSQGPSAYSLFLDNLTEAGASDIVPTNMLLDYPLSDRLAYDPFNYIRANTDSYSSDFTQEQLDNCPSFVSDADLWKQECVMDNDLWTEVARAFYGVIVPGTNTYLTLGRMGGIRHGMGYKITPVGANGPCSGECPHITTDWDNYLWLYDVNDLIAHRNGEITSFESRPYEYGAIVFPFNDIDNDGDIEQISGADYDPLTNRLYILLNHNGDTPPTVVIYEIALNRPKPPLLLGS